MKTFYEDWPETFVSRLDMLRALDDRGSTRRLYLERTGVILTLWQKRYVQSLPGILKSTRVNLISGRCIAITNVEKRGIRWLTYLLSWLHQLVNGFVYLLKCTQSRICFLHC